jgi:hypothetical protein
MKLEALAGVLCRCRNPERFLRGTSLAIQATGVGERGRNRTFNLLIKSQLLCQLSYAPFVRRETGEASRRDRFKFNTGKQHSQSALRQNRSGDPVIG